MINRSPVYTRTPTMYLDFTMSAGARLCQTVPQGWNAFVYILSGSAFFGPGDNQTKGTAHHTLVLGEGDRLEVDNKDSEVCQFALIGGQPLKETVLQHGPFVMNTQSEIQQATLLEKMVQDRTIKGSLVCSCGGTL